MANGQGKNGEPASEILRRIPRACQNEAAACQFLELMRWQGKPACPRCGDTDVYRMQGSTPGTRSKRFLWRCRGCKRQFTVRIGTVLEESRIPLRHWCFAFWAACASKKGVSAKQIQRQTGLSYKSALFLMHRIRYAMAPKPGLKLRGDVEADETFVGGKPRVRARGHGNRKNAKPKTPVLAIIQRGGDVRARVIPNVTTKTLKAQIERHVHKSARLLTDEWRGYQIVGRRFRGGHETVCHSRNEYARGDVNVNTCEGFFSLLKRGVYGTLHSVSKQHLHRYVAEFEFRYNTRKVDDGERVRRAIQASEGKRLMYREPIRN